MDLLSRAIVGALVVILILFAIYYAFQGGIISQAVTQQHAASLIATDLQQNYPGAEVTIINNTPSNYSGSWHIVASVVLNATSPCPSYFVYTDDYPQFPFNYGVQNTYTNNCRILGYSQSTQFLISSYPVAVTKVYQLGVPVMTDFIDSFGFSNVVTNAEFFNRTNVLGQNYTNVWSVSYSSPLANYTVHALISQANGNLLASYSLASANATSSRTISPNLTAISNVDPQANQSIFACSSSSDCAVVHTALCFNNAATQQACISSAYAASYQQAYQNFTSANATVCSQYYVQANVSCACISSECSMVYTQG